MAEVNDVVAEWTTAMEGVTPGPWKWWTSCSWRRLSSAVRGHDRDGGVICPIVSRSDGHPDLIVSDEDMAWIARCSPSGIRSLLDLLAHQAARLEEKDALIERLKLEAQIHAGEARCHKSTVHEAYQACTGATGEPGNWHGAEPIKAALTEAKAALTAAEAEKERLLKEIALFDDVINAAGLEAHDAGNQEAETALAGLKIAIEAERAALSPKKEQTDA
jgi:hypothetical protein